MIIDKTKFGLPLFDDLFGGIFRDRMTLCCGKYGSGKSMLSTYFLNQGISDNDNTLLLTVHSAEDIIIIGESLGFPFSHAVESGLLTILEYNSFFSDRNASDNALLPPDAFLQLERIIENKSIRRIAFNTVIPWVAITPAERIPEHVFSFSRAISRLHMTTLLTLPKPVSAAARTLKNRLDDVCPVSMSIDKGVDGQQSLNVTKYIGQADYLSTPIPFTISPRSGIRPLGHPPRSMKKAVVDDTAGPLPSSCPIPSSSDTRHGIPAPAIAAGLPFPFPPPPIPSVETSPHDQDEKNNPTPGTATSTISDQPMKRPSSAPKGRIAFSDAIKFPPVDTLNR